MPPRSRVTLNPVLSANQTAPSGPRARRLSLAIGVSVSGNDEMVPSGAIRDTARAGESVNQAAPSAAAASPIGSTLSLPLGSFSILPLRRIPIASENSMVNQTVSSGPMATAVGMSFALGIGYSTKLERHHGPTRQATAAATATTRTPASNHPRLGRAPRAERRSAGTITLIGPSHPGASGTMQTRLPAARSDVEASGE